MLFGAEVSKFSATRFGVEQKGTFEISFGSGSFVKIVFAKGQIVKICEENSPNFQCQGVLCNVHRMTEEGARSKAYGKRQNPRACSL